MAAIDLPRLSRLLRLPDKNRCIGYQDKKTSDGSCINPVEKHGAERIIRYFLTDPLPEKQLHRVLMDIASTSLCGDHRKDQVTYIANRWETRIRKGYPELIEHDPDMRLDASPEGVAKDLQTTIRRVNGAIAALAELQEDMKDVDATLGDVQRALNGLKGNDQSIKNNVGLLEKTVSTMKDEFRRKLGQVQKNMEEKLRDELEALQENQFDVSDDDEEEDDDDDFESRPTTSNDSDSDISHRRLPTVSELSVLTKNCRVKTDGDGNGSNTVLKGVNLTYMPLFALAILILIGMIF